MSVTREVDVLWKVATEAEATEWRAAGELRGSALDEQDGFIHTSDAEMVRKVAAMFFANRGDCVLLRIDCAALEGRTLFVEDDGIGTADVARDGSQPRTMVKLAPDGCAHIFRAPGDALSMSAVQHFPLPLDEAGAHVFPEACAA